ncbi:hypothetical protein J3B02_003916, partial [Coemansia erecta]
MEVRLDAFSASDFNVKSWLNEQFATLDAEAAFDGAVRDINGNSDSNSNSSIKEDDNKHTRQQEQDTLIQKLTTQLHLLATNAQQNSDRIKARFRHQAPQIIRDLAALAKLVKETQASVASFAEKINARSLSAPAIDKVVDMDTVRHQLDKSILALRHLRDYTDLPQKITALVDSGDLDQAWQLLEGATVSKTGNSSAERDGDDDASVSANTSNSNSTSANGSSVGLNPQEVQRFKSQIEAAALARLEEGISDHDAQKTLETARLLESHSCADAIGSIYIRLRSEIGARQLQPVVDECRDNHDSDNIDAVLNLITELMSRERTFIEAAELSSDISALLEALFANYLELLQPVIQRKIDAIRSGSAINGADGRNRPSLRIIDLYRCLASFYVELSEAISSSPLSVGANLSFLSASDMLFKPVPRSLVLLFVPFVSFLGVLGSTESDFIRDSSLLKLKRLEPDYARIESYIRDSSAALLAIFVDVEQVLERVFSLVPVSKLRSAISEIASVVADVSSYISGLITDVARRTDISLAALEDFADLTLPSLDLRIGDANSDDPIYQPITSGEKLEAVSSIVGLSILSRVFDQYASALSISIEKQWTDLLDNLQQQQAQFLVAEDIERSRSSGSSSGSSSELQEFTMNPAKLLLNVFMESCATTSEMRTTVILPLLAPDALAVDAQITKISSSGLHLSRKTASAVFFLLASAFRPPLARIPRLTIWHTDAQSKSSMNIEVPVFSSSPSEEAVDIGEKLHILLPELEQVDAMDAQYIKS